MNAHAREKRTEGNTMTDKNNIEIQTGDICEISGAYFKNDNGFWLVTAREGDPTTIGSGLTLKKIGKTGNLLESGSTVAFWPLASYCSDYRKNAAAKAHNRENAQIERVNTVPTWYAAQYFRKEAEEAAERVERMQHSIWSNAADIEKEQRIADFYAEVAARLEATAEQPKQKEPETGIKFFWNGIKVNGGKLIPCYYSLDNNADHRPTVHISAKGYGAELPREYFTVRNETDLITDYHDTDRAVLTPKHPLYKFARYAALKNRARGQADYIASLEQKLQRPERWSGDHDSTRRDIEQRRAWIAEYVRTPDPGQPTAADLAAVAALKTAQESARLAEQHAAELAEREKALAEQHAGRVYIEEIAVAHPIEDGAPVVTICWSEHPAFTAWGDDELKLSVSAAEIILKHFDERQNSTRETPEGQGWYFKTKFSITWNDHETGEQNTYTGRYDLGDNDGGMIEHIRSCGRWNRTHDEQPGADTQQEPAHLLSQQIAP